MDIINETTMAVTLTLGQLTEFLKDKINVTVNNEIRRKQYYHGIDGLCELLGCGRTKASEIKSSGVIDEAITQIDKLIIIDGELALNLLKKHYDRLYKRRQ